MPVKAVERNARDWKCKVRHKSRLELQCMFIANTVARPAALNQIARNIAQMVDVAAEGARPSSFHFSCTWVSPACANVSIRAHQPCAAGQGVVPAGEQAFMVLQDPKSRTLLCRRGARHDKNPLNIGIGEFGR